jgi:hypothetical protein
MKKVKNANQAIEVFQLLGIKDVTKDWQRRKGTKVFELPFKTMYANGYEETNRFSIYKSGYVRKMLVNSNGVSYSCYQLNKTRTTENYRKYYKWNDDFTESKWTGTYIKSKNKERIMIPKYEDRLVYLCNYILKNYYRSQTGASFYRMNNYQVNLMKEYSKDSWELDKMKHPERYDDLPFDGHYANPVHPEPEDVQVIINGYRYKLS